MRRFLLIAVLGGVTGCFVSLKSEMDSWVGAPADQLVMRLGAPTRTADLSTGGKVLTWVTHPNGGECVRSFTASAAGIVTAWSADGCPAQYRK